MKNHKAQTTIIAVIFVAVTAVALIGYLYLQNRELKSSAPKITPLTWEECLKFPEVTVQQTYPSVCRLPDGRSVVQPLSEEDRQKFQPPVTDDPVNWEVYVSDKLSLSFKHPDSVIVSEEGGSVSLMWYRYNTTGRILVVENIGNLSLMDYARNNLCLPAAKEYKGYCDDQVKTSIGQYKKGPTDGVIAVYNLYENPILTYLFLSHGKIARFEFSGQTGTPVEELDLKVIDQILSTLKFLDLAGSDEPVSLSNFSGKLVLNGYLTKLERSCSFNEDINCKVRLAVFTVLTVDNPQFSSYLKDLAGNAFVTSDGIVLGCIDEAKKQVNSSNDADTGTVSNLISGGQYDLLVGSSLNNPVNLSLEKPRLTGGRGAPDCYSHFRNFKVN